MFFACGPRSWRSPPFRCLVVPLAGARGGVEDSGPDGRVRGDEQDATVRPAEGEVDGAGHADLADEVTGRVEHLDAAWRRGVDAPRGVGFQAVREPGGGDGEKPAARQVGTVADVEGEDAVRPLDMVASRLLIGPAVGDVKDALVWRERQSVRLVKAVRDDRQP